MSETVLVAIVTFIFGSAGTAALNAYLNRRKAYADTRRSDAESDATEASTRRDEVDYYQRQVKLALDEMTSLKAEVKSLKEEIEDAQRNYERRVGELIIKIDSLALELSRANTALDIANKTIVELRQEVKDGNAIITELRKEITQLLVEQAAKKKDGD